MLEENSIGKKYIQFKHFSLAQFDVVRVNIKNWPILNSLFYFSLLSCAKLMVVMITHERRYEDSSYIMCFPAFPLSSPRHAVRQITRGGNVTNYAEIKLKLCNPT